MEQVKTRFITVYTLIFICIYMIFFQGYWKSWRGNDTPFKHDVDQYYSYLPATFIHQDLDFNFPNQYWLITTPTGHRVPKMTCGMAILYSPFFFLGHKVAINQNSPLDGYSQPYKTAIHLGSLIYCFFGLVILAFVLRRFFSDAITALTLITIFFATNLFNYTMRDGEMSHSYGFFLISLFTWLTCKWHERKKSIYFLWIGLTIGLASLVRPTEIFISIVFIFYGIHSFSDIKTKLKQIIFSYKNVPLFIAGFLIIWLPQLIFWKMKAGQFFFFSYGEEGFFWTDPQIINLLFSYRKGWLVYTPVMVFAIAGLFLMKEKARGFRFPIIIYLVINIYVLSCWWCWWYGGSFGMRSLVQCYAFLAIPMAAFYDRVFSFEFKKEFFTVISRSFVVVCLGTFLSVNLIQTNQLQPVIMHYDSMTKEAYWLTFCKFDLTSNEWGQLQSDLVHPDYDAAMKGEQRD